MITFDKFQQENFEATFSHTISGVAKFQSFRAHLLDDNKMITNDNIFAKFGKENFSHFL